MRNKKGETNMLMSVALIVIISLGVLVGYNEYIKPKDVVSGGGATGGTGGTTGSVSCGTSNARVTLGPVKAAFNPATATANVAVSYWLNGDVSTLQSGKSGDIVTIGPNNKISIVYALDQALDNAKPTNGTNQYYSAIVKDIAVGCDDFQTATKDPAAATLNRQGNLSFVTKGWDGTLNVAGAVNSNGTTNYLPLTLNDNKDTEFTVVAPSERSTGITNGKIIYVFQGLKSVYNKIALTGGEAAEVTCPSYASAFSGVANSSYNFWCYSTNSITNNAQNKYTLNIKTLGTTEPITTNSHMINYTYFPEDLYFNTKTGEVKTGVEDDQNSAVGFNSAAIYQNTQQVIWVS